VDAIVAISEEMANWRGVQLSGVNGQNVLEPTFNPIEKKTMTNFKLPVRKWIWTVQALPSSMPILDPPTSL
jgi:hypothetical protein